jgi:hypothetical protein
MADALTIGTGPAAAGGEGLAVPEELREAWEERAAIIAIDGHLTHAKAERLAWVDLQPQCFQHGRTFSSMNSRS